MREAGSWPRRSTGGGLRELAEHAQGARSDAVLDLVELADEVAVDLERELAVVEAHHARGVDAANPLDLAVALHRLRLGGEDARDDRGDLARGRLLQHREPELAVVE